MLAGRGPLPRWVQEIEFMKAMQCTEREMYEDFSAQTFNRIFTLAEIEQQVDKQKELHNKAISKMRK